MVGWVTNCLQKMMFDKNDGYVSHEPLRFVNRRAITFYVIMHSSDVVSKLNMERFETECARDHTTSSVEVGSGKYYLKIS